MTHRCECGSRVFFSKPIEVIREDGCILEPRDFKFLHCVSCVRCYVAEMSPGKKTLVPAPTGRGLEKMLLELAIEYGWFQGHKAQVNAVVIDPDDQTDLERLGIEMREPQKA